MTAEEYIVEKIEQKEKEIESLELRNESLLHSLDEAYEVINALFSIAEVNGHDRRWINITIWDDDKLFDELIDKIEVIEND